MIYPSFLKKKQTIGISAPSAGVGKDLDAFDLSMDTLHQCGFKTVETAHVRVDDARGGTAVDRGQEVSSLFANPNVDFVMCAAGGDFLYEVLPHIKWGQIKKHPKWYMGASDPTGILFCITTKYDIATIYGYNAGSFDETDEYHEAALKIMQGKRITQYSSSMHSSLPSFSEDYKGLDTPTLWKSNSSKNISFKGRCIGGCMDVLKDLIGTKYEDVKGFVKRYKEEGIVWYFDVFSMSAENFYRTLLQMRYAGWFENTSGILIGRVLFESSETGMSYEDAITLALNDIPVIYEADIGHTSPKMVLINGAVVKASLKEGKGTITFQLK